jgi:hypothetical protein
MRSFASCTSTNTIGVIKSIRIRWTGHVARMGDREGAYRVLVGRLDGKRPLEKHRLRWKDSIKLDLNEVGWGGMDWTGWLNTGTDGGLL